MSHNYQKVADSQFYVDHLLLCSKQTSFIIGVVKRHSWGWELRAGVESVEIRGTKSVYYRVHLFGNLAFGNMSFLMATYIQNKKSNYILHAEGM